MHANTAVLAGGGMAVWDCCPGSTTFGAAIRTVNSIYWSNTSPGSLETSQVYRQPTSDVEIHHSRVQGWTGTLGGIANSGQNPLFLDPDGPDGLLGNEDDNLHLLGASDCIDAGVNNALPDDVFDIDGDMVTGEFLPLAGDGLPRFVNAASRDIGCGLIAIVDLGPFEFGTVASAPRRGDLNGDAIINGYDLGILLGQWGDYKEGCRTGDLNFDLEVDGLDLAILLGAWG